RARPNGSFAMTTMTHTNSAASIHPTCRHARSAPRRSSGRPPSASTAAATPSAVRANPPWPVVCPCCAVARGPSAAVAVPIADFSLFAPCEFAFNAIRFAVGNAVNDTFDLVIAKRRRAAGRIPGVQQPEHERIVAVVTEEMADDPRRGRVGILHDRRTRELCPNVGRERLDRDIVLAHPGTARDNTLDQPV